MPSREYDALRGPKRLGDRLLEAGLITRTQLDDALAHQQAESARRPRLGRALVALGYLSEPDLVQLLSAHFAIPVAPFSLADAEPAAVRSIPNDVARRHRVMPCRIIGGSLLVAVGDPLRPAAVDELQVSSGRPVLLYLASDVDVEASVLKHYGAPSMLPARLRDLARRLDALADGDGTLDADLRAEIARIRGELGALLGARAPVSA